MLPPQTNTRASAQALRCASANTTKKGKTITAKGESTQTPLPPRVRERGFRGGERAQASRSSERTQKVQSVQGSEWHSQKTPEKNARTRMGDNTNAAETEKKNKHTKVADADPKTEKKKEDLTIKHVREGSHKTRQKHRQNAAENTRTQQRWLPSFFCAVFF